jgi:hypothetical protein
MIALFALCVFSLRKPKVLRSNLTRRFHSPKSVKVDLPSGCDFSEAQADEWIADCKSPERPCTWGHENCPPLSYKEEEDWDNSEVCKHSVCINVCWDQESEQEMDWCYPGLPNENWTVDDWEKRFERGKEGKCDLEISDDEVGAGVDFSKREDDLAIADRYQNQCKAAWKVGDKYVGANCYVQYCDAMCARWPLSWCPLSASTTALSTGAIAGIAIACVIVVGGLAGGLVFFCTRFRPPANFLSDQVLTSPSR